MAYIASYIDRLLQNKFVGKNGEPDSKSAYFYLIAQRMLPGICAVPVFSPGLDKWSADIETYSPQLDIMIRGHGSGGRKKMAEQVAYGEALRCIQKGLREQAARKEQEMDPLHQNANDRPISSSGSSTTRLSPTLSSRSSVVSSIDSCHTALTSRSEKSGSTTQSKRHGAPDRQTIAVMQTQHSTAQQQQVRLAGIEYDKVEAMIVGADKSYPPVTLFALDIEKYEKPGRYEILELGLDVLLPGAFSMDPHRAGLEDSGHRMHLHFVVKDNLALQNVRVKSDRAAFAYGTSYEVTEAELLQKVQSLVGHTEGCFWVGHSIYQDFNWLERRSGQLQEEGEISFRLDLGQINTIDIALLDRAIRSQYASRKLGVVAAEYGVESLGSAHNGGNDAVVTQETFLAMVGTAFKYPTESWLRGEAAFSMATSRD